MLVRSGNTISPRRTRGGNAASGADAGCKIPKHIRARATKDADRALESTGVWNSDTFCPNRLATLTISCSSIRACAGARHTRGTFERELEDKNADKRRTDYP